jgi:hypothetical protein
MAISGIQSKAFDRAMSPNHALQRAYLVRALASVDQRAQVAVLKSVQ